MTKILHENALEKKISFSIDKDALRERVKAYLQQKAARIKMDGFRPGKAPLAKIYEQYGREAIDAAVQECATHHIPLMTEGKKLWRGLTYQIEGAIEADTLDTLPDIDVTLSAIFCPDVPEVKLDALSATSYVVVPSDQEVEVELAKMASNTMTSVALDQKRPARKGDTLVYTMVYDNGKGLKKEVQGQFILGQGMLPAEFEENLEGTEEGTVLREKLKVPAQFPDASLAGQKVFFSISFLEIRETVPYEVSEEFAHHLGEESLQALTDKVRKELAERGMAFSRLLRRRQLAQNLMGVLRFDVSDLLVNEVFDRLCSHEKSKIKKNGGNEELGQDILKKLRSKAVDLVRLESFVKNTSELQKIYMTEDELMGYARSLAQRENVALDKVVHFLRQNPKEVESISDTTIERKTLDWVADQAQQVEQSVTQEELKKIFEESDDGRQDNQIGGDQI